MSERSDAVLKGDIVAGSQLMRGLDDQRASAIADLKTLYKHTGKGYVVGITGNPGAGKSTVVDSVIAIYRKRGFRVGVVAVDPTSPFTGGAILGDRIRMQKHALDDGVFIRSLATRGQLGGLSRSTFDVVSVLDAMGYDRILIETVGVGQDEVDVMKAAATSVVITVPGLGDDIQAIKAGILEIADVLVVNKSDREGADRAVRDLFHMLDLRAPGGHKEIEILKTIAAYGQKEGSGMTELVEAIESHREKFLETDEGKKRQAARAGAYLAELVRSLLSKKAELAIANSGGMDQLAANVADRTVDPYTAAEEVVGRL